ncbi:MAG: hypothetical protein ABIH59_00860 [archaeon]
MTGKNSQLHLYLETSFYNRLKKQAKERDITISELCREKLREPEIDLKRLAFNRLKCCRSKNGIISFKNVWIKLCTNFSIKKEECWKLLRDFHREGRIEFVKGHGVRIIDKNCKNH